MIQVGTVVPGNLDSVWRAWTDPEQVARWWGGWPAGAAPAMDFQGIVGGRWRFAMALGDKTQWVGGHITELVAPHRLGLTFAWEGVEPEQPATPVTVELSEAGPGEVRVELVHDQSLGGNACADGWSWSLECLRAFLAAAT